MNSAVNLIRSCAEPGVSEVLPGFEHVNRYWDRTRDTCAAKILPGEYYVTCMDEIVTTVLGSCVSACVRDRVFGIGGMNHFMLPVSTAGSTGSSGAWMSTATRYGNFAMEHLINDILKFGGQRRNLEIKIFGGGRMLNEMSDVGRMNIDFILDYLRTEQLPVLARDLGDVYPRKVVFYPTSGRAVVKKLRSLRNDTILQRERSYLSHLKDAPLEGDVEIFSDSQD